uniref:Leukemia inhibitory factor receptor-like n=1 Tax=Gouania willdenowi TaxID=441366 RepID=A0A8C5DCC1_GOUWI
KQKWTEVEEEKLVTGRRVVLWVKSHVGNSTCTSPNISVQLGQIGNLSRFFFSLNSSYQVKIRHQSNQVKNPLWSKWSPVVSVPAGFLQIKYLTLIKSPYVPFLKHVVITELGEKPEVTVNMQVLNGTRKLTLSWKEMPPAASVRGVNYTISNSQSLHRCPCSKEAAVTNATKYTVYASYSAVNISVVASNAAGKSPPTILQVPAEPLTDLKSRPNASAHKKFKKKTCLEWFPIYKGEKERKEKCSILSLSVTAIQDYVRYIYLEHKCHDGKPLTVKKCLFYRKEGAPNKAPQDFIAFSETHTSVNLSWTEIPIRHQRGFLTHYKLCSFVNPNKSNCFNVSSSVTNYSLENLLPETKYNISLARVTAMGEGPKATVIVNTKPEKPLNGITPVLSCSLGCVYDY